MPLPKGPLVVNGGCNCGAVRYKINIPELLQRPVQLFSEISGPSSEVWLPMVAVDHCNDCRRATRNLLTLWICTATAFVTASLILCMDPAKREGGPLEPRGLLSLASEIFAPGLASSNSFLSFYRSSELWTRSSCGRCGTYLANSVSPMPEGWPDMLDILFGTVDREDLEGDALVSERQVWWDCGIAWIKQLSTAGAGDLPIHATIDVSQDIRRQMEEQDDCDSNHNNSQNRLVALLTNFTRSPFRVIN